MRIARVAVAGEARYAEPVEGGFRLLDDGFERSGEHVAGSAATLLPAVAHSAKFICIGLNYRDHAAEAGADLPSAPLVFAKLSNALLAHGEAILLPPESSQVDWEGELGVVIGRSCSRVAPADALRHVLGYTCVNDVSARDLQFADGQWTRGKSVDTFGPVGPCIVGVEEIPDPNRLTIETLVNGETMQRSNTAEMVFPVAELISYLSQTIRLEPGDLIATGTPAGVGVGMSPPRFLAPGDTVEVRIEGIGSLRNPVVAR